MPTATELARAVVTALIETRVTDVVIAPGSRNAPLSFAVFDAARAGLLRLHTRIDERSAGFYALGLTKVGTRAAVMCTSGTAVANLHPSVLEAAHAGVPLAVVTADRPARLRETGANQVTDQVGVFGRLIETRDLDASPTKDQVDELDAARGPVHWNVQLDVPLTPPDRWQPAPIEARPVPPRPELMVYESISTGADAPRTVVVAGDDAGPPSRILAQEGGWPLLAEPSSGARTGDNALRSYRLLLESPLADRIERVVVYGHPTLSRPVTNLLARDDVQIIAAPVEGAWPARPFRVDQPIRNRLHVDGEPDPAWLEEWRTADRTVSREVDRMLHEEQEMTAYDVAACVARALPDGGLLMLGPSNPVRDLDLMLRPNRVGGRRKVIANRGLAGIDGIVSTAIGAAVGRPASTRALALMGDVTFLHDAGGLLLGPEEVRPDLTIVVANDDGGSIFASLEQGADDYADSFERLFGTPHGTSLEALCAAHRIPHLAVSSVPELEAALASPNGRIEVVEATVSRTGRRALDLAIRALARS
ncbi:2-succinyl-5-enolpyruvyl-6-hydroxy-3-cyclohexene-1-carboxylate synthase [Nocardioides luteus]|uniref:2-succinyl-5-enolpyruvyl-6-hydroxy-3-cyclohexene-1-carboxylate synthase n=1 Tax=Nocardioides luteus TaxID=1844 RepID=A0ABQ5SQP7_9ACTN|nr:2-succinyl-5-enolpyruvyl-6-hydroxy-3-cyclohexene-1-carboxylic-acid synthase [Nocardioides luteus]MDR7313409.1 2-succinyl-5-enolpyruvyl-6-hydroxy-3-cyclohexene-1-carboxylate synthase [Nocardioides luteus]GGR60729.1 2-succinyl-5-enolpyruvyl-6-hydroxy-3-cyclohexene-1-carboxylate synthase [Nocardioides luteus]GLJ66475.1 2-succinyl-5-enolpyruvyl-6-hydroxy-3-cyclohexene- 1-carboxylate synthase [Nocardioides luteus]